MASHKRYVDIKKYAELCETGVHAIYNRIYKSMDGKYPEDHELYLTETLLEDTEGAFIDTERFPPKKKGKPGRKKINN